MSEKSNNSDYEKVLIAVRKQLQYLLEEGVVVVDHYNTFNEAVYRLKTEQEIEAELDLIINS